MVKSVEKYLFREMTSDEIPEMFELILRRMEWMDLKGIKQWNVTEYDSVYPMEHYEELRRKGELFALVDRESGELLCAGALLKNDPRWEEDGTASVYLHHLVSRLGHTGVGKAFIALAEEYAGERGMEYFRLDSADDNETLTRYYEGMGYFAVGHCVDGLYSGILRQKKLN